MLGGVRLKVSFTHERTCFAYISPKYSTNKEKVSENLVISVNNVILCNNLIQCPI